MPVLVLLAIFSVPLAWIASRTYLKAKQLKASREQELQVRLLEHQVKELTGRIEVLETIATDGGLSSEAESYRVPRPHVAEPVVQPDEVYTPLTLTRTSRGPGPLGQAAPRRQYG